MNQISVKPPKAFAMMGISSKTGYELIRNGKLAAIKITGKRWLVPISSIEEYVSRKGT